jgi:hypothetical protein
MKNTPMFLATLLLLSTSLLAYPLRVFFLLIDCCRSWVDFYLKYNMPLSRRSPAYRVAKSRNLRPKNRVDRRQKVDAEKLFEVINLEP